MSCVILILSVSPRIVGFGKLSIEAVFVEVVSVCAKEITSMADGTGNVVTLAILRAAARGAISACQSNMATEIGISDE